MDEKNTHQINITTVPGNEREERNWTEERNKITFSLICDVLFILHKKYVWSKDVNTDYAG